MLAGTTAKTGQNSEYRTNILTSRATLAALRAPGKVSPRPLGTVQVKGRAEPIEIFAIESPAHVQEAAGPAEHA